MMYRLVPIVFFWVTTVCLGTEYQKCEKQNSAQSPRSILELEITGEQSAKAFPTRLSSSGRRQRQTSIGPGHEFFTAKTLTNALNTQTCIHGNNSAYNEQPDEFFLIPPKKVVEEKIRTNKDLDDAFSSVLESCEYDGVCDLDELTSAKEKLESKLKLEKYDEVIECIEELEEIIEVDLNISWLDSYKKMEALHTRLDELKDKVKVWCTSKSNLPTTNNGRF